MIGELEGRPNTEHGKQVRTQGQQERLRLDSLDFQATERSTTSSGWCLEKVKTTGKYLRPNQSWNYSFQIRSGQKQMRQHDAVEDAQRGEDSGENPIQVCRGHGREEPAEARRICQIAHKPNSNDSIGQDFHPHRTKNNQNAWTHGETAMETSPEKNSPTPRIRWYSGISPATKCMSTRQKNWCESLRAAGHDGTDVETRKVSHRETTVSGRGIREEANRDVLACVLHQRRTTYDNQRRRVPHHEGQAHDGYNHNHNYGEDRKLKGRKSCTGKGGEKDSVSKEIVSAQSNKRYRKRERERERAGKSGRSTASTQVWSLSSGDSSST